jgi:predicted metal-dependent phosphoesterase TrpH
MLLALQGERVSESMTNVLKVDLHLHTAEDPEDDIVHDARTLVERASDLGFDALAITLHNRQLADARLFDYAADLGITLIPGIERSIEGRHVLLINFPSSVESVTSFADLALLKSRTNGIVIAPHPFFPHPSSLLDRMTVHADLFDAVEWSYFWTGGINFNAKAARWAAAHGKPLVGNSDLHDMRQFGRTCSRVFGERSADGVCHAIRQGRVAVQTTPAPASELARVVTGMFRRGRKALRMRELATT